MPKADDPHVVLGVAKGAAVDEIKKAFRARARGPARARGVDV